MGRQLDVLQRTAIVSFISVVVKILVGVLIAMARFSFAISTASIQFLLLTATEFH